MLDLSTLILNCATIIQVKTTCHVSPLSIGCDVTPIETVKTRTMEEELKILVCV